MAHLALESLLDAPALVKPLEENILIFCICLVSQVRMFTLSLSTCVFFRQNERKHG